MKSEWKLFKIEDLADVKSGKRLPKEHSLVSVKTNYPYIRLVDVSDGVIQKSNIQYLMSETRQKISRYIVETNDICLAIVGNTIGMVFQVDREWNNANLTENAARLTNFRDIAYSKYIYYYLISYEGQNEILSRKVGSAQGKLPMYNIKSLEILLPPLPTQKKIAHILSTLDDKIELNRKMNQTLEEMAQALFKSWFVDFDPVHAKAKCASGDELETAARELGISKEILELFPSEFEESELGMIPRGWGIFKLGDVTRFQQGKQIELEDQFLEKTNEMTRFVRIIDYTSENEAPRYIKVSKESSSYVTEDDVVMIRYGSQTAGKVVMGKSGIIANNMFRVIPIIDNLQREYLYYFLKSPNVYSHLRDGQSSSTMPAITFGLMASLDIVLPEQEIVVKFNQLIKSFITKYFENDKQIETLQKTRDTLLPKLLSGELDVSELDLDVE